MKITYKKLMESFPSLRELRELKFLPRLSMDLLKLNKQAEAEVEDYKELASKIYESHEIPKTAQGFNLEGVSADVLQKVVKELEDLLNVEVEIRDVKIPFQLIERMNQEVSTRMLEDLSGWLIVFEEEPEEKKMSANEAQ